MTHATITASGTDEQVGAGADGNGLGAILQKHRDEQGGLIAMLEEIQQRYGYLPEEALRQVSATTGRSLVDIYGVATFYRAFTLKPRGAHVVCACLGTACHVRGAAGMVARLEEQLGIAPGETTSDGQFTLETANCLGACAVGPVVVIDGCYFSKVRPAQVAPLLEEARHGFDKAQPGTAAAGFPIDVSCPRCNHSLMDGSVQLDDRPTIRLMTSAGARHGWWWLSALYGSAARRNEQELAPETVLRVFCPHCHAELAGAANCATCHAPLVPMLLRAGGIVQFCSRRGCRGCQLDLDGLADQAC